jgi:lysozyme
MTTIADLLRKHEGLKLHPYRCEAGKLTIGYGHNLDAHNEPAPESITLAQAEELLEKDIADARMRCELFVPGWGALGEVRRAVMIDMCFNLGTQGLLKFTKMLGHVAQGRYYLAAQEMRRSAWFSQVGSRARTLARMMELGEWPK